MPQMDIKSTDSDDGKPYLSVGWDAGDMSFLILYAKIEEEDRHGDYAMVTLDEKDIHELKRFLHSNYGPYTAGKN
jgi:hypothetical protein